MIEAIEKRTIAKVSRRVLPFVVLLYFVAYLDRVNVSFAALTMNRDLGFSAYLYGWGAGIFFLGYFLFEVPSNVILERAGARRWIARIMITWGLLSGAMAMVGGPVSFLVLRFLLGVAEAGFFPGIIFYLTYWFPAEYRARVIASFMVAIPISNAVGSPISGLILQLDGSWGLAGWQWLFLIEAAPAVILAFVVLAYLTDRPDQATWLEPDERQWLIARLHQERQEVEARHGLTLRQALTNSRVLVLAAIYLGVITSTYGITFFLPQIIRSFGLSTLATGFVTAIPYAVGAVGMTLWGRSSDRTNERRWHLVTACVCSAVGLAFTGFLGTSPWALVAMSVAAIGLYGALAPFWPLPSLFLTGPAAAGGIAMINSIGNLGGFAGPYAVGWIKDSTQSFASGLYFLAACAVVSGIITLAAVRHAPRRTVAMPQPARQVGRGAAE
jgi:ACS family tartrate transporter-like MFS transporter